jgi:CO/xanthine dehydrogenase Mo-binding subunit
MITLSRREFLQGTGALVVGFAVPSLAHAQRLSRTEAALGKTLDTGDVDGFIAVNADGSVTIYSGKVDLGQGLRIAIPQMAAEELGIDVGRIAMVEGDTALTPDQGATGGSSGIMRGGIQIRQAAATARQALIGLASARTGTPAADLDIVGGEVRPKSGGEGIRIGELVGDKRFNVKLDPKAKLRDPAAYKVVGKPIARPDIPAKVSGRHVYMHDLAVDGMLHGRVVRPPAVGATLVAVDEGSIASIPGARVVRVKDFLGVVAADEWDAMSAARLLDARWSESATLLGADGVRKWMRSGPFEGDETLVKKGDAKQALAAAKKVTAEFYWPMQSHASLGPSCAIADVREGKATVWSASQATHRFRETISKALALSKDAVRVIYLDGAGCYGMNGHDDAATDAALMSKAVGRPVRVQWSRRDEHGGIPRPRRSFWHSRLGDERRQDRCVAHRDVDSEGDGEPAEHAAAGARCRRHRADAGHHDGPHQPERRSAIRGAAPGSARALAEGRAAAAVEFPRAGQGRELLRRRKFHRHACRGCAARPGRISVAGADGSARRRGDPANRRADRLATACHDGAARHRQRTRLRVHPLQAQ